MDDTIYSYHAILAHRQIASTPMVHSNVAIVQLDYCGMAIGVKYMKDNITMDCRCDDIDECSLYGFSALCAQDVLCLNTYGSYHCGPCPAGILQIFDKQLLLTDLGQIGDGRTCERMPPCQQNPCHQYAECTNLD